MAMIDHAPDATDEREYAIHAGNYRSFLHVLWSAIAGDAIVLILLAAFFG